MSLFVSVLIPNLIGFIGGLIGNAFKGLEGVIEPSFSPPGFIFPIVWTILFTLMGISSYIIYKSKDIDSKSALRIYIIQLIVNSIWNIFFFKLKWFLFAFIWLILLLILVIIMIYKFYKINKLSAYLQILYVFWLIFASILTFSLYLLN